MKYVGRFLLLMIISVLLVACSGNSDEEKDEATVDDLKEALGVEDNDEDGFDVEAIEEEMGIDKSENQEIPEDIPSDVPLPDDMEIEMTIDNLFIAQVRLMTDSSEDELKEMYEDYINSNPDIGEPDIYEDDAFISYRSEYQDGYFTIDIYYLEIEEDYRTVAISFDQLE